MPDCPICAKPLATVRQREGVYYHCPTCDGRAVTLSQIRHVMGDRIATKLVRLLKLENRKSKLACPFCHQPMLGVKSANPVLELDACRPCNSVWFDAPTYDSLPQANFGSTNTLAMEMTEIVAMNRLRELKEKREADEKREKERKKKKLGDALGTLWNQK